MRRRTAIFLAALVISYTSPLSAQTTSTVVRARMTKDRPVTKIYKGNVPIDPKYLKYQHWYKNHSVVDVIIEGSSQEHLIAVLREIAALVRQKVTVGKVVVVGGGNFSQLDEQSRAALSMRLNHPRQITERILQLQALRNPKDSIAAAIVQNKALIAAASSANLGAGKQTTGVEQLLAEHKITDSPVWIVTHRGRQFFYEGLQTMASRFSPQGDWLDLDSSQSDKVERKHSPITFDRSKAARGVRRQLIDRLTFEYSIKGQHLPSGAREYDAKPNCQNARTRRNPVLVDSAELGAFDIVFYNPDEPAQLNRSELWAGPTAPYLVGDLTNPYRVPDRQQELGRFFDIRCLPTRIHYVWRNGARIEEYREGEYAWE